MFKLIMELINTKYWRIFMKIKYKRELIFLGLISYSTIFWAGVIAIIF